MQARPTKTAAGIVLAFSLIAGSVIGIFYGEPSVGLLSGLGVGIALAALGAILARRS